jgi:hypothetical protein
VAAYLIFWEPPAPDVLCFSSLRVHVTSSERCQEVANVNTAFGGSLTAADVGTGLVDFLVVCEELLRDMPLASLYSMKVVVLGR